MRTVVLFHHVLGLTPGVLDLAERMRAAGHEVVLPDLFEGRTFSALADGLAYVSSIGDEELLRRAEAACEDLPVGIVYAGLSLGVMPAQHLLLTRPGAAGAVLLHAFIDPAQLGGTWPEDCEVDVLGMDHDPFLVEDGDLEAARSWQREHGNLRITLYPGTGHLFMEPGLPDHDAAVTDAATADVLAALARMDRG